MSFANEQELDESIVRQCNDCKIWKYNQEFYEDKDDFCIGCCAVNTMCHTITKVCVQNIFFHSNSEEILKEYANYAIKFSIDMGLSEDLFRWY